MGRAIGGGRTRRDDLRILSGELIGAPISITEAPGIASLPLDGTVVDETLHLLWVRPGEGKRARKIPKEGLRGTVVLEGREIPLSGDLLRMRPEDRTKRLLVGGPRRFP